jgi:hypothetical protein
MGLEDEILMWIALLKWNMMKDGMEVTNNTLLNMVHIEKLGDSMVELAPL